MSSLRRWLLSVLDMIQVKIKPKVTNVKYHMLMVSPLYENITFLLR